MFEDAKGREVTVALTARRSRLHPGTRYLARGLNGAYSTGGFFSSASVLIQIHSVCLKLDPQAAGLPAKVLVE